MRLFSCQGSSQLATLFTTFEKPWIRQVLLYYTILYYTILYYTILYYTILYYTIIVLELSQCPKKPQVVSHKCYTSDSPWNIPGTVCPRPENLNPTGTWKDTDFFYSRGCSSLRDKPSDMARRCTTAHPWREECSSSRTPVHGQIS